MEAICVGLFYLAIYAHFIDPFADKKVGYEMISRFMYFIWQKMKTPIKLYLLIHYYIVYLRIFIFIVVEGFTRIISLEMVDTLYTLPQVIQKWCEFIFFEGVEPIASCCADHWEISNAKPVQCSWVYNVATHHVLPVPYTWSAFILSFCLQVIVVVIFSSTINYVFKCKGFFLWVIIIIIISNLKSLYSKMSIYLTPVNRVGAGLA